MFRNERRRRQRWRQKRNTQSYSQQIIWISWVHLHMPKWPMSVLNTRSLTIWKKKMMYKWIKWQNVDTKIHHWSQYLAFSLINLRVLLLERFIESCAIFIKPDYGWNFPTKCVSIVQILYIYIYVRDAGGFPKTICAKAVWRLACVSNWIIYLNFCQTCTHTRALAAVMVVVQCTFDVNFSFSHQEKLQWLLLMRVQGASCMRITYWKCSTYTRRWKRSTIAWVRLWVCVCADTLLLCGYHWCFNYCS